MTVRKLIDSYQTENVMFMKQRYSSLVKEDVEISVFLG